MVTGKLNREAEYYIARNPKSQELQSEAAHFLPGGSSRGTAYFEPYPHFIQRGNGQFIYDVDGNGYLDFMINATSLILGHAHPDVVAALQTQATYGTAFSGPTEAQIRMARILCDRVPSMDLVRFTNSGTEGTMMAIRAARAFTGRHRIAKFEGGYHGSHEYVSVSVRPKQEELSPRNTDAVPEYPSQPPTVAEDVIVMPYNDIDRCESILRSNQGELACVIMEAVVSAFGYAPAKRTFLQAMRELTRELGIILIFDEVQSFRISPGGAQEWFGVTPDMTTLGKIIGGGMPVGAFGGRADIMSVFDPTESGPKVPHAGTFNANPMTMVAGEVTMKHLASDVYERLNTLGENLRAKLRAVFDEMDVEVQVTGIGSLFGIHFTNQEIVDYRSVVGGDHAMQKALFIGLLNEGILLNTGAGGALNILSTEFEVDQLVDATRRVLERIR